MDFFVISSFISFDAPEPEPTGATPIDTIPINQCDGGSGSNGCVVA
jgi:hypothetical protein